MMFNTVFYIIIIFIVFDFILDRYLAYLNSKTRKATLPDELRGIYDEEKYAKSIAYEKENARFELITGSFDFVLILAMLFFGGFAWVDAIAGYFTENPIFRGLLFFLILGLASDLIHMPFSIYDTFVIEQKFGFNKTTPKLYVLDKLKGWLLALILGGGLGFLILWFYYKTTTMFWIYAWILTSVFTLFFTMFYSNIIVPLFNKQEPLPEGELKDEINNFASKVEFKLKNIFSMDGSKRSSKANAYFTGIGAKKRIVLFDTLIKELSVKEIVAVLAHEIGHYKHKHTSQGIIISLVQMGLTFFLLSIFLSEPSLSQALGVSTPSFHIGIIAFGVLYSPFSLIIGLLMNMLSRKNEYQADNYAKTNYESEALISALKKLSVNNLSNLTPHPTYVFFHYSHPTLLQRIRALRK
ncbi:MAG TPA: M48 family metallopeptidase [Bacteroidales bacterium]|nr:M48 family metallopeptidase [Bacteroidales bacterium]